MHVMTGQQWKKWPSSKVKLQGHFAHKQDTVTHTAISNANTGMVGRFDTL